MVNIVGVLFVFDSISILRGKVRVLGIDDLPAYRVELAHQFVLTDAVANIYAKPWTAYTSVLWPHARVCK
jgi:hypothetical protein